MQARHSSLKDGWYDLGLAYAGANDHAEAIAAFRKQIELDPNHKHANGDLAMELQQTGKTDEAIAAYRKQLETTPYEKATHQESRPVAGAAGTGCRRAHGTGSGGRASSG